MKLGSLSLSMLLVVFLLPLSAIGAQNSIGVSITPLKWELSGNKGVVLNETVTAINPNDFPLRVVPEFQDFRVLENAGIQWIPNDVENPYRMTDWITIQHEPITLKPKEQLDLPFTIKVPANASVGGHYAAIFFKALLDSNTGNLGSVPRVGALIIFNVNGPVKKGGEITNFSAPNFVNRGPVTFDLSLKNTGTTHYEPTANVTIQNLLGPRAVITAEKGRLIYPGVSRNLKVVWNKNFPLGIYSANVSFIDGEGKEHSQSTWFIGFPWKYFLGLLGGLLMAYYLIRYLKRKFRIIKV